VTGYEYPWVLRVFGMFCELGAMYYSVLGSPGVNGT
jgi:hypothetical protein